MAKTHRYNTKTVNDAGNNTDRQARNIAVIKNRKLENNWRTRDHRNAIHDDQY